MRSSQRPDGLPAHQLSQISLDRLRAANRLYAFTVQVINTLNDHTVWTVENPSRSYLWETSYFQELVQSRKTYRFEYHMCMFGGLRFKRTDILTNRKEFENAIRVCSNDHEHLPYTVNNNQFDTSLEAQYPKEFCKALTQVVRDFFNAKYGWTLGATPQPKQSQQAAVATGSQPTKKIQPLVAEFSHVQVAKQLPCDFELQLDNKRCLLNCLQCGHIVLHCGSKLLRRTLIKGGKKTTTTEGDDRLEDAMEASLNPVFD